MLCSDGAVSVINSVFVLAVSDRDLTSRGHSDVHRAPGLDPAASDELPGLLRAARRSSDQLQHHPQEPGLLPLLRPARVPDGAQTSPAAHPTGGE